MKNVLKTSLFAGLLVLFAVSCTDEHYYVTEEYYDVWTFVQEYEVGTGQLPWVYDEVDDLFYCSVSIEELTNRMYDEGILAGYVVLFLNEDTQVDTPLPYSKFYVDNAGYQWSYQYTCEFSPGKVTFIFKDSNYSVPVVPGPPACTFVIKMMR